MDAIALGCALAEARGVAPVMQVASALGHGAIAGGLAAAALLVAVARRRRRLLRVAAASLLAIALSGIAANLLKLAVDSPRPYLGSTSAGFPSGHTTIAFAAATVLTRAFPPAGPFLFLGALMTGVARLYLEAHFAIDVVGGAFLGALLGLLIAGPLVPRAARSPSPASRRWLWGIPVGVGALILGFFVAYEQTIAAQRAGGPPEAARQPDFAVPFGQPAARAFLRSGWSADERWGGRTPFVWVEGKEGVLHLPALPLVDHDLRLRLAPLVVRDGFSCQRAEVSVNGTPAGRVSLARGWNDYLLQVPGRLLRPDGNDVRFRFAYAKPPGHGDPRRLSGAFASLEARRRP